MSDTDKSIPTGEILLYETEDGNARVECRFIDESLWLSQSLIAELFGVSIPPVNEQLKKIFMTVGSCIERQLFGISE